MKDKVFRIGKKKYSGKTSVVSARLSDALVADIDQICELTGRNRNDVIEKCLIFAIENFEFDLMGEER